jgi:ABC-type nitrate/sulfonate/bicarbonate transport system substrate-binding protein
VGLLLPFLRVMGSVELFKISMSILFVSLLLVVLSRGSLFAAELEKVRVGLSSISATHGALWVAEEKGIFKKYGLDPEVSLSEAAAPEALVR